MSEAKGKDFVMKGEVASGPRPIDFTTFLLGLASTTLIHLGVAPHPETQQRKVELELARETLDLLAMLREKTHGNLTAEEDRLFEKLLTDLRIQFVESSKR
jgi:hypothetical protein